MKVHLHKKLVYKVVYGFNKGEHWRIEEDELEKFLYAQRLEKVVATKGKQINGRNILRIEEDWHYYTGWNYDYVPSDAEDRKQIERDAPVKELAERMKLAEARVSYIALSGKPELLKEPEKIQLPQQQGAISDQVKLLAEEKRLNKKNE